MDYETGDKPATDGGNRTVASEALGKFFGVDLLIKVQFLSQNKLNFPDNLLIKIDLLIKLIFLVSC